MQPQSVYRIVVAVDFSETSELALAQSLAMARSLAGTEVHAVTVIDDNLGVVLPDEARVPLVQVVDEVRQRLVNLLKKRVGEEAPGSAVPPLFAHVRLGPAAEQVAALAAEIRADLAVAGTNGRRGVQRLLLGSVAERLVRLAPVPVLVVRPRDFSSSSGLPALDPPCPQCVARREATDGEHWWCEPHEQGRPRAHVYSFSTRLNPPSPAHHVL